jgi:hypothetical protein
MRRIESGKSAGFFFFRLDEARVTSSKAAREQGGNAFEQLDSSARFFLAKSLEGVAVEAPHMGGCGGDDARNRTNTFEQAHFTDAFAWLRIAERGDGVLGAGRDLKLAIEHVAEKPLRLALFEHDIPLLIMKDASALEQISALFISKPGKNAEGRQSNGSGHSARLSGWPIIASAQADSAPATTRQLKRADRLASGLPAGTEPDAAPIRRQTRRLSIKLDRRRYF